MGKNIKYCDIKNKSDDVDFIQIIDLLYQRRGDEAVLNSCEYKQELDKIEYAQDAKERFWEWFKEIVNI